MNLEEMEWTFKDTRSRIDPEQLWETTMNPETRTMVQVTVEDAISLDEIFTVLMGDDIAPRRQFIEENAKFVKNLDI